MIKTSRSPTKTAQRPRVRIIDMGEDLDHLCARWLDDRPLPEPPPSRLYRHSCQGRPSDPPTWRGATPLRQIERCLGDSNAWAKPNARYGADAYILQWTLSGTIKPATLTKLLERLRFTIAVQFGQQFVANPDIAMARHEPSAEIGFLLLGAGGRTFLAPLRRTAEREQSEQRTIIRLHVDGFLETAPPPAADYATLEAMIDRLDPRLDTPQMGPFAVADPYTPKDFNQAARTLLALFTTAYDVDLINHPPRTISLSYSLADPTPQPAPRPGVLRHCNLTLPYGVRPRDPDPETLQKALRVLYQVFRPVGIAKLYSNGLNPSRLSGHPTVVPRQRRIRITPSNEPAATLRLKRTLKAQARLRQDQRQLIELLHQHNIEADFISAVRQAAPAVSAAYRG